MKITVIGAGVVGLSVAYELASRGATVGIVDARGVALGATHATAGMLAPHIEAHSDALLTLGVGGLALYDDFIARLRHDAQQAIDYRRTGTLQVGRSAAEAQALREASQRLTARRTPHALLDAAGARLMEPALGDVAGALHIPEHGYVAVPGMVSALVAALARRQVAVSRAQVTDPTSLDADAIVIAAGSWIGDLLPPGPTVPVRPIRGQLLHLRLGRPPASRVLWGERCYIVPWQDGSVLVGATTEDVGFDETPTVAGVRELLDAATELLPELATASFHEVRAGLRPATADELPIIGQSATMRRVFYATGHYRSGVLLSPFTAGAIGDLILEGRARPELELVRPDRFGL